jgi:predicted alpha-1,6-mannanase (GH76 family)
MRIGNRFRFKNRFLSASLLLLFHTPNHAITADQAGIAIESFNNVYWRASNKTFYKYDNKTGQLDYWMWAHAWETEMDAYERTKDPAYLQRIRDTYDGFTAQNGTKMSNAYNDDQGWWVMAATRAYELTGAAVYRDFAKQNFDWMYANQVDTVFGGGIWWMNSNHNQKNSASTLPFSVAGFKLARALPDPAYADKARKLHSWVKAKLWRPTGEVGDRIERNGGNPTTIWGPLSYNHGTFISSSWEMFKSTGDSTYYKDALATLDYFKNVKCDKTTGIFPDERGDGTGNTDNDAGMYKTVFVHYAMRFIMEAKLWQYLPWLNANAESLWKNRRTSDNLMYFAWATPAPTQSGKIGSQMATGGVALLNLLVAAEAMQAFYSEGVDTTNAQGQGLANAFTVSAAGISANGNKLAFYHLTRADAQGDARFFNHSFADIQRVPADFSALAADKYAGPDVIGFPFVLRMADSTYAKAVVLKKLPDGRYLYRYGVGKVRGNLVLAQSDYPKGVRGKPNNFRIQAAAAPAQAGSTTSILKWEAPLANDNRLTGYEVYALDVSKADTTKPVKPEDWTLLTSTSQTAFTWTRVGDNREKYLNVLAVYESGKSAPLEGWTSILNPDNTPSGIEAMRPEKFSIAFQSDAFAYALPRKGEVSIRLYDPSGRLIRILYSGVRDAGRYVLPVSGWRPGSGNYFLKAAFGKEELSTRIFEIR